MGHYVGFTVGRWIGAGTQEYAYRPDLGATGVGWEDITGQPVENLIPGPNLYMVLIKGTAEQINAVNALPQVIVFCTDWVPGAGPGEEDPPPGGLDFNRPADETMPAAEKTAIYNKLTAVGVPGTWVTNNLADNPTRRVFARRMVQAARAYLKRVA